MISEDLRNYICDSLKHGTSVDEIRQNLASVGWSETEIGDAFNSCSINHVSAAMSVPSPVAHTAPWIVWCVRLCVAIIIVGLSGALAFLWQERIDLRQTNEIKVQNFFTELAEAQIGFTDAGSMVFPDEQKFQTQRDTYIQDKKDFVVADLRAMKLTLFTDGVATRTLDILTKGKEGSWWETPTGNYAVLGRWPNAFSSIGHVWMPYSIQFYGNYFIHGWPYYDNGTPVPQGYSGGCIRLATEDAKIVFNHVDIGTPILVLEDSPVKDFGVLALDAQDAILPAVTAKAFTIVDLSTGKTILERQSSEKLPVASLTKLMTAIVAHEIIYLGRSITVQNQMLANVAGAFNPEAGDSYIGLDLLYPLLVQSSNDTAQVLARSIGEGTFIKNMNSKAQSLEMNDTTFADASGISADNISTAHDLTKLLTYIYFKRPFIFDITKGITVNNVGFIELGNTVEIADLKNYNEFFDEPDLIGVKNGQTTAARETMATVWRMHTAEAQVPVAIVVLGSDDRKKDTEILHTWLVNNYKVKEY